MEMEQVKDWIVSGHTVHTIPEYEETDSGSAEDSSIGTSKSASSTNLRPSLARSSNSSIIKRMVSKNRRRFVNEEFDLDLSYITSNIVSMSYPAVGGASLIRNSLKDLQRFLMTYHYDRYKVYNLCSELEYDHSVLDQRVVRYPCDDMQPPPLEVIYRFCEDAMEWIQIDPENIVVVHCQAGKGRTGVMVAALLLYMNSCDTAEEALQLFAQMRTNDGNGVSIPSQVRYINYFSMLLKQDTLYNPDGLKIVKIHFNNMVSVLKKSGMRGLYLSVSYRNLKTEMQTEQIATIKFPSYKSLKSGAVVQQQDGYVFVIEGNDIVVSFEEGDFPYTCKGDVKVQIFKGIPCKHNSMFYVWFNAGVEGVIEQSLNFGHKDLDKMSGTTKKNKLSMDIQTIPSCDSAVHSSPRFFSSLHKTHSLMHWEDTHPQFSTIDNNSSPTQNDDIDYYTLSRNASMDFYPCNLTRAMSSVSMKSMSEEAMAVNPKLFGYPCLTNQQIYARKHSDFERMQKSLSLQTPEQVQDFMDKTWFSDHV